MIRNILFFLLTMSIFLHAIFNFNEKCPRRVRRTSRRGRLELELCDDDEKIKLH